MTICLLAVDPSTAAGLNTQIKAAGLATRTTARNRTRSVRRRAHAIGAWLRRRTGSEARISHLKRDYGWARTRVDGISATQAWCGWGVLAHNATKVSALLVTAEGDTGPVIQAPSKRPANRGTGPQQHPPVRPPPEFRPVPASPRTPRRPATDRRDGGSESERRDEPQRPLKAESRKIRDATTRVLQGGVTIATPLSVGKCQTRR